MVEELGLGAASGSPAVLPRLLLRKPQAPDARALSALAGDPRVSSMIGRAAILDGGEGTAAFQHDPDCEIRLVLELQPGGEVIGLCSLSIGADGRSGELGYWLGVPFWGRGYGTQAVQSLIDLAFSDPDLEIVATSCRVVNAASRRVAQKCGLQFCGTGMCETQAGRVAAERFRLDRRCWASLKAWGSK